MLEKRSLSAFFNLVADVGLLLRFMAASKVLGEETVTGAHNQGKSGSERQNGS
jgi:hypothetical protein